jgi:hypothetical protein
LRISFRRHLQRFTGQRRLADEAHTLKQVFKVLKEKRDLQDEKTIPVK